MKNVNHSLKKCNKALFKKNNLFFITCLCSLLLSGCFKYQYISVNSKLYQNEKKEFVCENDTVLILYTFSGQNFPINFTIYNKLEQPIYIDWVRSTVIMNNEQLNVPFYDYGQINFVAPRSYITIAKDGLRNRFFDLSPKDSLKKIVIGTSDGSLEGKRRSFNEGTTPIHFRSILALTTHEDFSSPAYIDNSFWISGITQSMANPSKLLYKPSNQFYLQETTGAGKCLGWTAAITILVLLGFAGADQ
jgi:hypothetical protein